MEHTPAVSCFCMTYARPELLEEAIYSLYDLFFEERLSQQFPGATKTYDIKPEEIYYLYRWAVRVPIT